MSYSCWGLALHEVAKPPDRQQQGEPPSVANPTAPTGPATRSSTALHNRYQSVRVQATAGPLKKKTISWAVLRVSECLYVFVIQVLYSFVRFEPVRFNRAWVSNLEVAKKKAPESTMLTVSKGSTVRYMVRRWDPPHFFGKVCNCHLRLGLETEPTNVDSVDWYSPKKKHVLSSKSDPKIFQTWDLLVRLKDESSWIEEMWMETWLQHIGVPFGTI